MSSPLPQLHIGPIAIDFPVVQAALAGYSDRPARVIARRMGAGFTLSEVMLDRFVTEVKGARARRFLQATEEEQPCGAQLMGSSAEPFAPAALRLVGAGFAWIDLNFACPVRKVLARCRGGYLLERPQTAVEVVARVRDALPPHVPVTVKMRRGTDDSPEARDRFFALFQGALARGAAAVTVHGRTVRQRYQGHSDWGFLAEVKRQAGAATVLGSGDLFTAPACLDLLARTGLDGASVARGAIGNPWIFRQARALAAGRPLPAPPRLFEQRELIREHFRLAEQYYGVEQAYRVMRKFGIKYSRLHPRSIEVRDAMAQVSHRQAWEAVLARYYAEDLPGREPDVDEIRATQE
jgi:nifR3 family TIM-barrel protein